MPNNQFDLVRWERAKKIGWTIVKRYYLGTPIFHIVPPLDFDCRKNNWAAYFTTEYIPRDIVEGLSHDVSHGTVDVLTTMWWIEIHIPNWYFDDDVLEYGKYNRRKDS